MKIALIITYFGKFPWYFRYFIHSCRYNLSIDFFIITDNAAPASLPPNVYFINRSMEATKQQIEEKLGLKVTIDFPYKLCDFKPAYGLIFSDLIKTYDFWGHGDIDVIYGNIRGFMTDELLQQHDLVAVRHDFLTGYFTLFRNCPKMNELFRHSKDYEKIFESSRHFCFDETNFSFELFAEGIPFNEIHTEVESMTHVVKKLHDQKYINAYFNFHVIEGNPGRLRWDNGILTYRNRFEVMLYHMVRFKTVCVPSTPAKIPDVFHISPTRIYA